MTHAQQYLGHQTARNAAAGQLARVGEPGLEVDTEETERLAREIWAKMVYIKLVG